jgi:hypothetical protein
MLRCIYARKLSNVNNIKIVFNKITILIINSANKIKYLIVNVLSKCALTIMTPITVAMKLKLSLISNITNTIVKSPLSLPLNGDNNIVIRHVKILSMVIATNIRFLRIFLFKNDPSPK